MRRIVVEMGYWLSPLLRDHPIPVLTEWERTVDLTKLDHNHKHRQEAADRREQKSVPQGPRGAQSTRQTVYRNETLAQYRDRTARNNKAKNDRRQAQRVEQREKREAEKAEMQRLEQQAHQASMQLAEQHMSELSAAVPIESGKRPQKRVIAKQLREEAMAAAIAIADQWCAEHRAKQQQKLVEMYRDARAVVEAKQTAR